MRYVAEIAGNKSVRIQHQSFYCAYVRSVVMHFELQTAGRTDDIQMKILLFRKER
jgi:hypothetical protein